MQQIFSSGIDGSTGDYLFPALSLARFAQATRTNGLQRPEPRAIQSRFDARDLSDAGWGIIFPQDAEPALRENLSILIDHRGRQIGGRDRRRFKELVYLPGETKLKFLGRNGSGPGPVDPRKLPYYLLIVGGPERIPFEFQYGLGVQHAVGRLCFEDPSDYAAYGEHLAGYETSRRRAARRAAFFATAHADDPATELSASRLVEPLVDELTESAPGWQLRHRLRSRATKSGLAGLLSASDPPDLLFTAGHAVGFSAGSEEQKPLQGALLCSDWPGPRQWRGRIPEGHFFAADDLAGDARLDGLLSFHFACYSAGTPRFDSFPEGSQGRGREIAPEPFVARLAQKLLRQGAIAVIGHVDRAWEPSFVWGDAEEGGATSQIQVFASAMQDLMEGVPVGLALSHFGQRYAEIASELLCDSQDPSRQLEDHEQASLWTACNDARSYVVVGDPAARLSLE